MDDPSVLFAATANRDKLVEIRRILSATGWEVVGIESIPGYREPLENGATLRNNALVKAWAGYRQSGLLTVADDSGLEVDALKGLPGVHSARYAGESADYAANVAKLLAEMKGVPSAQRDARFRCVMALVGKDIESAWEGVVEGSILTEPRGERGFGYDPVFWSPDLGKTFAEAGIDEKNRVSHRARALAGLILELNRI